ncbi:MAG: WecB/TagA/CpsF family glycosyltransferase, partial [Pseudomonadota bacterium]
MSEKRTSHTTVGAVPTAIADEAQIIAFMVEDALALRAGTLGAPKNIFDTNGQAISMFATNKEYADSIRGADLVHADGQFIVWMSKLKPQQQVPERTATTDLIFSASEAAAEHGIKFYLLGGSEEINRACAEALQKRYPTLQIVGRRNGYFTDAEEQ